MVAAAKGNHTFRATPAMREAVKKAAGIGMSKPHIARMIINPDTGRCIGLATLERHFAMEIIDGVAQTNHDVSSKAYELCMKGNVAMIIWWEKTRQGRYERRDYRGMAKAGDLDVDPATLAKLTDAEINALEKVLAMAARGKPMDPSEPVPPPTARH